MGQGSSPPAVAFQRSQGPFNEYNNESASVQHHLDVHGELACVEGNNQLVVPGEDKLRQQVPFVKSVQDLLLQTQEQHGRGLVEVQDENHSALQEGVQFIKQRSMLEKTGQAVRVLGEYI